MLCSLNYADHNFLTQQKRNTRTAYAQGDVDHVFSYCPCDIDHDFRRRHRDILEQPRGGGYWLWKPYFILRTLRLLPENAFLFYCDAGAYFIRSLRYLEDFCLKRELWLMPFDLPFIEEQYTKNETFRLLGCDTTFFRKSPQILATYFMIRNTDRARAFFEEFLNFAQDPLILTDITTETQSERFLEHRHDQSIFSLLCKKYGIASFRDPSQFGDFNFFRKDKTFEMFQGKKRYVIYKEHPESIYPRILISQRRDTGIALWKYRLDILRKDLQLLLKGYHFK